MRRYGCAGTRVTNRRSLSGITCGSGRISACSSARRSATTPRVVRCPGALVRSPWPWSWAWKSSGFAKRRPASKLPSKKRWLRSSAPLAWQSPASEDHPAQRELAAEGEELFGRVALRRDRALAVPDQLARQRAQPLKAAAHPERDIRELLREHQRAGERAREGQLTRDDVAAARLAPPDRDLRARLTEIELRQLARAITRALKAARRRNKPRPQLAQQLIKDR